MKLATWNVNSIRARHDRVIAWTTQHQPDVLCLQETKVADADFPIGDFAALGYEAAICGQRTYNGVAILSRTPLADVERGFGDGVEDGQCRFITATTAGVRVMSAYFPNGETLTSPKFAYKLEWMRRLATWLKVRLDPAAPAALCGDFNVAPAPIDVHDPALWASSVLFAPAAREALDGVRDAGLVDLVRRLNPDRPLYSWWDYRQLSFPKGRGLRIDHVFVTPSLDARAVAAGVDRDARKGTQPSDHAPVWAEFR
jgi:exodeoxyribonuclease III